MKYSEAAVIALIEGGEARRIGGWIVKGRITTLDQLIQVLEEDLQADDWYVAVSCKNPAANPDKGYIGGLLWERVK